jgi:hypothetical protein
MVWVAVRQSGGRVWVGHDRAYRGRVGLGFCSLLLQLFQVLEEQSSQVTRPNINCPGPRHDRIESSFNLIAPSRLTRFSYDFVDIVSPLKG